MIKYLLSIGFGIVFYVFLFHFFPVEGGGASLIVIYYFPILLIACGLLPLIENLILKRIKTSKHERLFRSIKYIAIVFICLKLFPCGYYTTDCPLKIMKDSFELLTSREEIEYDDLFLEQNPFNYSRIVLAQKKFKDKIPEKVFFVDYFIRNDSIDKDIFDNYAIYELNGVLMSSNKELKIEVINKDSVRYSFDSKIEPIEFFGASSGFEKYKDYYEGSGSNVDGYIYLTKVYDDFTFDVSWEYRTHKDFPGFFRLLYIIG